MRAYEFQCLFLPEPIHAPRPMCPTANRARWTIRRYARCEAYESLRDSGSTTPSRRGSGALLVKAAARLARIHHLYQVARGGNKKGVEGIKRGKESGKAGDNTNLNLQPEGGG